QTGTWQAHPVALDGVVTPILVTVDNQGDVPLRIRHSDFALVSGDGRRFVALPPGEVHGAVADSGLPGYAYPRSVFVMRRDGGGRVLVTAPFPYDPFFDAFPAAPWTELPTHDMIQRALPPVGVNVGAGPFGAHRSAGSRRAVGGAIVGGLAGLLFAPLGLLVGPVIGAVAGEMIRGGDVERSLRTGVGALIGMVAGSAADFVISVAMIGLFLWWVWRV